MIFHATWLYSNKNEKLDLLREDVRSRESEIAQLARELEQLRSVFGYTVAQGGELIKDGQLVAPAPEIHP